MYRQAIRALLVIGGVTIGGQSTDFTMNDHACLRYEPDTVAITGILVRKTFPGPPNYESIAKGDKPETGFYLELARPICTVASADSEINQSVSGVHLVQLVLDQAGYDRLRPGLGHVINVRGKLFAEFTAHHHAPLLLDVIFPPDRARGLTRA